VPEKNLIIVVLTNVTSVPAAKLWIAAANTALGLPIEQERRKHPQYDASPAHLARFEGRYRAAEGQNAHVFLSGNTLMVESEGVTVPLTPTGEVSFIYTMKGREQGFKFYLGDDGKSWSTLVGHRMLRKAE